MNDFNIINNDTNNHKQRSQPQLRVLARDYKDYSTLINPLKQLQINSSKILKQYHDFLKENNKKTLGIPYHMIKKFQQLKKLLGQISQLIKIQGRFFSTEVQNREFQKGNQQSFFKKTLLSYDEKRLWLKNYILQNEKKMQGVQDEVKKNVEYETHKYTQFLNTIDIQRLQHNYTNKLQLLNRIKKQSGQNVVMKYRIKDRLIRSKKMEYFSDIPFNIKKQPLKFELGASKVMTFLFNQLSKQSAINQLGIFELRRLTNTKVKINNQNIKLNVAIDLLNQEIQKKELQFRATQLYCWKYQISFKKQHKLSRTDFLIYLKQLHREISLVMKQHGTYFQYSLVHNLKFPHTGRSRSSNKFGSKAEKNQAVIIYQKVNVQKMVRLKKDNLYISYKQKSMKNSENDQIIEDISIQSRQVLNDEQLKLFNQYQKIRIDQSKNKQDISKSEVKE